MPSSSPGQSLLLEILPRKDEGTNGVSPHRFRVTTLLAGVLPPAARSPPDEILSPEDAPF